MNTKCDLHIHSCLSPCADKDMTPCNIAGMAHLAGLNLISLTDHNSTRNLPATVDACGKYGIAVLCGIEVCTSEEIHILCYFETLKSALDFGKLIEENMPCVKNKVEIYGEQLILNSEDETIGEVDNLLIIGCDYSVYELADICHSRGGVCIYAHIDRQSFSVISVLGAIPEDISVEGVEIYDPTSRDALIKKGFITQSTPYMSNSDAHSLGLIGENNSEISQNHPLYALVKKLF